MSSDTTRPYLDSPSSRQDVTIMIVEDEEGLRRLLVRRLRRAGFRVFEASCADTVLAGLEFGRVGINLLLTDVLMPGMDGCELAREVRRIHPEIKIMYMSGAAGSLVPEGEPFLQKPFSFSTLMEMIGRSLNPPANAPAMA